MMIKNSRRKQFFIWILSGLVMILTGCAQDIPALSVNEEAVIHHKLDRVLLKVNQCTEDGYETKTSYDYNEKGQIVRETNSFTYDDETSVEVYDLSYDSAGRLIKKTRSSGDSGWSNEELERKYDASGNMISESSYKFEDVWHEITYTYNSDNRVEKEIWSVDYTGDGSDAEKEEYQHTYTEGSDGTLEDKRQWIQDGEVIDENTNLYDSSGRLIQGFDDYWAAPVRYEYYDDQYFNLYTEYEKIDDGDENEESSFTYAEILDAAGKAVEKISLSDKPEFEHDSEGYLIKATDYYGLTELHYGRIGENIAEEDNGSEKNNKEQKSAVEIDGKDLLKTLSGKKFVFSSGAGGWMTEIDMAEDGSFEGYYMDSDLGVMGPDYPNGTTYESSFTGRFVVDHQVDEYTYSAQLKDLKTKDTAGTENIIDGEKRIAAEPYGFETGTDFLFYAPGHPVNTLKTPFLEWITASAGSLLSNGELTVWGLYNVDPEYPMYEDPDTDLVERMKKEKSSDLSDDKSSSDEKNKEESTRKESSSNSWDSFISNAEYENYFQVDDDLSYSYAIYDLDGNGINELLLEGREGSFCYTWIFINADDGIHMEKEEDEEYGNYGYGQYRFIPERMEIVGTPGTRPFSGTGGYPFYKLKNGKLELQYFVGQDEGKSYKWDGKNDVSITDEEREDYYKGIIEFDWESI